MFTEIKTTDVSSSNFVLWCKSMCNLTWDPSFIYTQICIKSPSPQFIPRETVLCCIDGVNFKCLVGSLLWMENICREIQVSTNDRRFLHGQDFDLMYWTEIDHIITKNPHLFQIWVFEHVSMLCNTNNIQYKCREISDPWCPYCKHPRVN